MDSSKPQASTGYAIDVYDSLVLNKVVAQFCISLVYFYKKKNNYIMKNTLD
jgi:hypothetical protein